MSLLLEDCFNVWLGFQELYGKEGDNVAVPLHTSKKMTTIDRSIAATAQNARTVKRFLKCTECGKPRVSDLVYLYIISKSYWTTQTSLCVFFPRVQMFSTHRSELNNCPIHWFEYLIQWSQVIGNCLLIFIPDSWSMCAISFTKQI